MSISQGLPVAALLFPAPYCLRYGRYKGVGCPIPPSRGGGGGNCTAAGWIGCMLMSFGCAGWTWGNTVGRLGALVTGSLFALCCYLVFIVTSPLLFPRFRAVLLFGNKLALWTCFLIENPPPEKWPSRQCPLHLHSPHLPPY